MNGPYGIEVRDDCHKCDMVHPGYFCNLSEPAIAAFERMKFTSLYPTGAVLFVEGQSPRGVYMVCKGRVKLTMASAEGKTILVRICDAGEMLGLHSTIGGEVYELTAETLEPCQVNFVRRNDFLRLLRDYPETYAATILQLTTQYRGACHQIRYLGLAQSATEKLARFLVESSHKGETTSQGVRINLRLTHEEIAQVIGVSRETVTRSLSELRTKMVIATKGPHVLIRNRSALEAMVAA